ncbi:MAG TPA: hypothetical protein VGH80_04690 [Xanthomonadaceae bacterium]
MRHLLLGIALGALCSPVLAYEATRIRDVPVFGQWHDVPINELREAVDYAIRHSYKPPSRIEVIDREGMRVWLSDPEMGWEPLRYVRCCTVSEWNFEGESADSPRVLRFIRTASEAYIFPVPDPLKPHLDRQRMRRIEGPAREALVGLLGEPSNWYDGLYNLVGPKHEPPGVGFVFRQGASELILFQETGGFIRGTFNDQHVQDMLDGAATPKLLSWERTYAPQELESK